MSSSKLRVRIRLHLAIQEVLEREADWEGIRLGTLTNRILQNEFDEIQRVGIENCRFADSEPDAETEKYYIIPSSEERKQYMPTNSRGQESGAQVSLFMSEQQYEYLCTLTKQEMRQGTWKRDKDGNITVTSVRYIIVGLLLNSPQLKELTFGD